MGQPWLGSYPAGVPADVDHTRYASLPALFEESFDKYRNDTAYICMGKSLTYGELEQLSRDLGAYLQSIGLKQGDRVALMMPNLLTFPIAMAAILRGGFIIVNVNPLYTPRELEHQLNDADAKAIIILETFAPTLAQVIDKTPIRNVVLATLGDKPAQDRAFPGLILFNQALAQGRGQQLNKPEIGPDDVAVLQYTGGTTGVSKGAMLLHKTIVSNLLSSEAWFAPAFKRKKLSGQATTIVALPLYHVFAFVTCSLLSMRMGGVCVLIPNPRDMDGMIKEIAKYKISMFPAVNTLFNGLAVNPEFAKVDFSELCVSVGGGTAVQEAVAQRWLKVTGTPIVEGYGLSETSSAVTCNPVDNDAYTGTIGLPMPGVDLKLLDDDGNEVAPGEPGEIALKAVTVMSGYWQRPDETEKAMTADGYFKTGDIGVMDERGYVKIVDRKKDMIIVSGFNVFPNEIEGVATLHPGVMDAACVGVPDEKTGEAVMLFVVKKDPGLTIEDLTRHLAENLTGYKKPRHIRFRDDLPRTNVGKILRKDLRDEALKAVQG